MSTFEFYRGDPRYPADAPHYVTTTASNWRSEPYRSRADAQAFIDGYGVTDRYKEEHYSIISVAEFWDRRNGHRPLRFA